MGTSLLHEFFEGTSLNRSNDSVVDEFLIMRCQSGDEKALNDTVTPFKTVDDQDQVAWILGQLNPEYRSVLALYYLQGFSTNEIAVILDKPGGTIKSQLFSDREKFREIIDVQEGQTKKMHCDHSELLTDTPGSELLTQI